MAIQSCRVAVTTTGSAGTASGSAVTDVLVQGLLRGVHLDFHASAPATTDTTISTQTTSVTLLTVTNSVTDALIVPVARPVGSDNAAITNAHQPFPIADRIVVAVAQCNALDPALVATIYWET